MPRLFGLRVAWPGLGGAFVIDADRGHAMQAVQNSPKSTIVNSCYTTMIQGSSKLGEERSCELRLELLQFTFSLKTHGQLISTRQLAQGFSHPIPSSSQISIYFDVPGLAPATKCRDRSRRRHRGLQTFLTYQSAVKWLDGILKQAI